MALPATVSERPWPLLGALRPRNGLLLDACRGPSISRGHTTCLGNWCPRACGTFPWREDKDAAQGPSALTLVTAKAPTHLRTWKHHLQTQHHSRGTCVVCWTPVLLETSPLYLSNPGATCWYPHMGGWQGMDCVSIYGTVLSHRGQVRWEAEAGMGWGDFVVLRLLGLSVQW